MRILKSGVAYFVLVFGAGFILGAIRVPFLVPRLGVRIAELLEMPFMLVIILLSARFIVRQFALPPVAPVRLGTGLLALGLLVAAELASVALLQDQSLRQYISGRDPVSGGAYLVSLGLFALMPLLLGRR
jgi:hypothetical protein